MTGPELLEMRRKRGVLDVSVEDFYAQAGTPEGLITELPDGRSILVKYFALPNGGSVATHEDCTEQRKLSRKLASTTQFLESVLDNVPVCVAAKNIEDGRYIFANRAFERFSRFSRDISSASAPTRFSARDRGQHRSGGPGGAERAEGHSATNSWSSAAEKRVLASNRVIARNEKNQPEFLIALFDDVTDRRSLSRELENTKKFLELVVDNIPVSLIVERVSDGKISARQPQRRDHPQPPPRGCHRTDRCRYLQSARSQADHRARRGGDQEARPAHRRTPDLAPRTACGCS
jgi:PAS domain-containing protein